MVDVLSRYFFRKIRTISHVDDFEPNRVENLYESNVFDTTEKFV